ncbi:hypothetical protein [Alteromonas sp. CyTr2]|uniref:hypothetical protein n=1 Tax=Alteromonas sp. CyTr2 TaxID=2935039 RepID=UPI00248DA6C3|nr:hypothetical protein [Alteromonas sp. CyTr2]
MLYRLSQLLLILGLLLLILNIYGLTQSLRPEGLEEEVLRFKQNDLLLSKEEFSKKVKMLPEESQSEYAQRLTKVIADGIAHVHWGKYDPDRFHQRVPIWENYILYLMGGFSGIPEFERYHFTIAEKAIERGVGLCGDASMLMSELLSKEDISHKIVTIPGHVAIAANADGKDFWLDPDFGVVIESTLQELKYKPRQITEAYNEQGFINNGETVVSTGFEKHSYQTWNGVKEFVKKKYYFERFSYFLIWLIPAFLILVSIFLGKKYGRR